MLGHYIASDFLESGETLVSIKLLDKKLARPLSLNPLGGTALIPNKFFLLLDGWYVVLTYLTDDVPGGQRRLIAGTKDGAKLIPDTELLRVLQFAEDPEVKARGALVWDIRASHYIRFMNDVRARRTKVAS